MREVFAVAYLQIENERRGIAVAFVHGNVLDVRLGARDVRCDRGEHAHAIRDVDANLHVEDAIEIRLPRRRNPLVRLLAIVAEVPARFAMDHDAASAREIPHDRIVRDREAAACIAHDHAFRAGNRERACLRDRFRRLRIVHGQQFARDERREALAQADLLEQLLRRLEVELRCCSLQPLLGNLLQRKRQLRERLIEQAPTEIDGFGVLEALQVVANCGTRLRRNDEIYPARIRRRAFRGDDLDRLPVAQRRTQRHEPPIDFCCHTVIADVCVHGVCEVDRGGVAR